MNEQIAEQTTVKMHTAEADESIGKDNNAEVSLGKFKDVNALINAYNSLQAEFTKRCQRIKELEGELKADKENSPAISQESKGGKEDKIGITDQDREEILKSYLKNLLSAKQQAIIMDGAGLGIKTPVEKPKTLEEAGLYAKEIFKK